MGGFLRGKEWEGGGEVREIAGTLGIPRGTIPLIVDVLRTCAFFLALRDGER